MVLELPILRRIHCRNGKKEVSLALSSSESNLPNAQNPVSLGLTLVEVLKIFVIKQSG